MRGVTLTSKFFHLKESTTPPVPFRKTIASARVYVAKNCAKLSQSMSTLFAYKPVNSVVNEPDPPTGPAREDHIAMQVYLDERKRALNRIGDLKNSMFAFCEVLFGQCSPGVQRKLKCFYDLEVRREEGDCAWLLLQIRQIVLA